MQYNIFKLKNKREFMDEILQKGFRRCGNTITSAEYALSLFCKYDEEQKLNWEKIFYDFGETSIPKKSGVSSIIVCSSNEHDFVITYGSSSFVTQKYSEKEFGFDFAKRIGLKEMKRKSSKAPHSNKNASITTYKNTKTILFDTGENITSLSFTPENSFYGKRIDIGKSIKLNVDISLENISVLFNSILEDLDKTILNNIPLLTKITNNEDIDRYYQTMYSSLQEEFNNFGNSNISQFTIDEFQVVGSSFYFEEEYNKVFKLGRIEKNIEIHNIFDLFTVAREYEVDVQQVIEKGKFVYKNSQNEIIHFEYIKPFISYEIPNEQVSLYDGDWYFYNQDYMDLIMKELDTLEVIYDSTNNITKSQLNSIATADYREQKINKLLASKYSGIVLDRENFIVKYEHEFFDSSYKVEIADFIRDEEYISVKVGQASALAYCIDQCALSARLIQGRIIKLEEIKLPYPKEYGVWFYLETNSIFVNGKANIKKLGSIMLLSKLCDWSKLIKSFGKIPRVYVNKYEKND